MNFRLASTFEKKTTKLCAKNVQLRGHLAKQFKFFSSNPRHPALRLRKLQGKISAQYAIWIKKDLRAIAVKKGEKYIFYDLIVHDEY